MYIHVYSTFHRPGLCKKKLFRLRIYCVLRSALRQSETTNYWPEIIPNSNSIVQSEEMGRTSAPDEDAALLFSVASRPQRPYGLSISDGEPRTVTSAFTQFKFSVALRPQETVRIIRDGEPRTATSTFTQLQSSAPVNLSFSLLLHVHRDHEDC